VKKASTTEGTGSYGGQLNG